MNAAAAGDGDGDAMTVYTLLYVLEMMCCCRRCFVRAPILPKNPNQLCNARTLQFHRKTCQNFLMGFGSLSNFAVGFVSNRKNAACAENVKQ